MNKVKILTDSCSDLGRDIRDKYDIAYAKMNINVRGQEKPASLDWDLYSPQELYDIMRGGERILTTQVPVIEFETIFEKYLSQGYDIVYTACSGRLSASVRTAVAVAESFKDRYPDQKIYCIDCKLSCLGEGLIAVRAAELRDKGLSAGEIAEEIEKIKLNCNQYVTVDSLDSLKRAGRVKASAAFFGNLFGVKPIIAAETSGQIVAIKKIKGRGAAMDEIVNLLKESMEGYEADKVFIAHADCEKDAEILKAKVAEAINPKEIYVNYIGPIIGASIGPGAVAVHGFGRQIKDSGEE